MKNLMKPKFIKNFAYRKTIIDLSEEYVAGIIKFHPEERDNLKDIIGELSWKEIDAYLRFRNDSLKDNYSEYKKILEVKLIEAEEHVKATLKKNPECKFWPDDFPEEM